MNAVRDPAVDEMLAKWRARWPEWPLAEPFVAPLHRERAVAWFALRDELTHAAWHGVDARPGEAKLAWWAEELQGWSRGVRRHPLGIVLQREPAAWPVLAAAVPSLLATRERPATFDDAFTGIAPFADAVSTIAATLFGGGETAPAHSVAASLLGERALAGGDAGAPLQSVAQAGQGAGDGTAARLWAQALLERWPPPHGGSIPGRLHAALVRERLRRYSTGAQDRPLPAWRALLTAWQAARR
ncbi:Phytoene/squalene synthetase [Lysobacter dokdonensis DS-58]|uniref:Phytoene/squalene synthetase n=1 Tax=Lysobacter dokdonensis DS-58 TaxID=1300345 RepID=A0A0A2X695_9GAMM|nr:phytoene/squalene synthase family protein [Lysobacter dokdonensis]KGQ20739.1 Phytoene/squalene synthetase [Lysobacter dokdonensis DS-58]